MPRLALWTFDEVPGSSVGADSETSDGTSQNGTFQNGATTSGSGSGVFNGSSDYFEIPYDPGFDLDTGSVAITFTQETASTGNAPWGSDAAQTLFSRDSSGFDGGGHLTIYIKADGSVAVRHQVPDQSFFYQGGNVTLGEPTTVIYTWSPTGSQLVVDGVVVDAGTEALTMAGNSEPIVIGATQAVSGDGTADIVQGFFDGTIEGVAIYDENVHANTIPCFTKGTLILTPRGELPIEDLSVGDLVCTADGPPQRIRWVGVRRLVLAKASSGADNLRPVRIAAGALGNGLPKRDLRVSRHHRMLVSSKIAARMRLAPTMPLVSAYVQGVFQCLSNVVKLLACWGLLRVRWLCQGWGWRFRQGRRAMPRRLCNWGQRPPVSICATFCPMSPPP